MPTDCAHAACTSGTSTARLSHWCLSGTNWEAFEFWLLPKSKPTGSVDSVRALRLRTCWGRDTDCSSWTFPASREAISIIPVSTRLTTPIFTFTNLRSAIHSFARYTSFLPFTTTMSSTTTTIVASTPQFETKDLKVFTSQTYGDWRDEFHRNGCVLIKNVISPERAKYYADKQIQWLKNFDLGFDEKDESTWKNEHLPVSFKGG
jgi:hypothetical protein